MDVSRHQRRTYLVQAIFLWDHQRSRVSAFPDLPQRADELEYIWTDFCPTGTDGITDFDRERFRGVKETFSQLQEKLAEFAPDWPLEKIASADRAILYLSLYELLFTDVPPAVVINEAVELAKEFGGDRSSKFVNGVLSSANKMKV